MVAENLSIVSLRREKDDVVEVREGFECGLTLGSFNDIKEGDIIETFEMREKPRREAVSGACGANSARTSPCTSERWSWTSCSGTSTP